MDKGWKFTGKASLIIAVAIATFMSVGALFNPSISNNSYLLFVLVVLGSVFGLTNIEQKNIYEFITATLFLSIAASYKLATGEKVLTFFNVIVQNLGNVLNDLLSKIIFILIPAAIIISIKAIVKFGWAKNTDLNNHKKGE